MHWLSFFVGILAGWIIEWLVDFFYTRKKRDGWAQSEAQLRTQLAESQAELEKHMAELAQYQNMEADLSAAREGLEVRTSEAEQLHADLTSANTEIDSLRTQLAALDAEKQTLTSQFVDLTSLATSAPAAAGLALAAIARGEPVVLDEIKLEAGDDLTLIEGVGPKIQELLGQSGIHTFTDLADADVEHLRSILQEAGPGFQMADPTSWPRQARLADNRDWVRLQSLKEQLVGGVRRPPSQPDKKDDLTVIEGIGPKVSALLNEHGIQNFAQLAEAEVERLQAILTEAGPGFQLASAAAQSWPEQARLAAEGDWEQFHTLKDRLEAGRGDSQVPGDGP